MKFTVVLSLIYFLLKLGDLSSICQMRLTICLSDLHPLEAWRLELYLSGFPLINCLQMRSMILMPGPGPLLPNKTNQIVNSAKSSIA
ncbi:hypothetical protein QQP08_006763 [Theobroma cacao]|nr:hypothetical protein QQP08_006763 [Theobroma cacao]